MKNSIVTISQVTHIFRLLIEIFFNVILIYVNLLCIFTESIFCLNKSTVIKCSYIIINILIIYCSILEMNCLRITEKIDIKLQEQSIKQNHISD